MAIALPQLALRPLLGGEQRRRVIRQQVEHQPRLEHLGALVGRALGPLLQPRGAAQLLELAVEELPQPLGVRGGDRSPAELLELLIEEVPEQIAFVPQPPVEVGGEAGGGLARRGGLLPHAGEQDLERGCDRRVVIRQQVVGEGFGKPRLHLQAVALPQARRAGEPGGDLQDGPRSASGAPGTTLCGSRGRGAPAAGGPDRRRAPRAPRRARPPRPDARPRAGCRPPRPGRGSPPAASPIRLRPAARRRAGRRPPPPRPRPAARPRGASPPGCGWRRAARSAPRGTTPAAAAGRRRGTTTSPLPTGRRAARLGSLRDR